MRSQESHFITTIKPENELGFDRSSFHLHRVHHQAGALLQDFDPVVHQVGASIEDPRLLKTVPTMVAVVGHPPLEWDIQEALAHLLEDHLEVHRRPSLLVDPHPHPDFPGNSKFLLRSIHMEELHLRHLEVTINLS